MDEKELLLLVFAGIAVLMFVTGIVLVTNLVYSGLLMVALI